MNGTTNASGAGTASLDAEEGGENPALFRSIGLLDHGSTKIQRPLSLSPHSAGVNYGSTSPGDPFALYVMTRRHLLKARNIASDPRGSLVIPIPRTALAFLPPATIQLHGRAAVNWDDEAGTGVFERSWMGRRILDGYRRARDPGPLREDHPGPEGAHLHGRLPDLEAPPQH